MKYQELTKKIPDKPGVYFFKKDSKNIYIGKATSLRDRVRSYFTSDIAKTRGPKIVKMLKEAELVDWQTTDSVLEALLLESRLIKKFQPAYNTDEKDDKSYNYVVITKEDFPRIFTVRGRELEQGKLPSVQITYGPFPHGGQLKEALKIIRKILPFRDERSKQKHHDQFYKSLGLSPDVSDISAQKAYQKTLRNIKLLFEGKKKQVLKNLKKEMNILAKQEKFEEATIARKQVFALEHIQDVSLLKQEHSNILQNVRMSVRIEGYDVAHMAGKGMVGVMVVLEDGIPNKKEYRTFHIRSVLGSNDPAALKEVLERRFKHNEWRLPDIIVLDGNLVQVRVAKKVFSKRKIPIVAVVKDERHRPRSIVGNTSKAKDFQKEVLLANSEAHRFALSFHKKTRKRLFLGKK